jgi:hypothetical protein
MSGTNKSSGEQLFSILKIARMWRVGPKMALLFFEALPGVLPIDASHRSARSELRRLIALRVPESVLKSVKREDLFSGRRSGWTTSESPAEQNAVAADGSRRAAAAGYETRVSAPPGPTVAGGGGGVSDSKAGTRLYSINEIARTLGIGPKTVLRMFEEEPGVLAVDCSSSMRRYARLAKLRFSTPRVPTEVVCRVYRRLQRGTGSTGMVSGTP